MSLIVLSSDCFPQIAVVTSADADHLDIYGDHESLIQSFKDFISQINRGGSLIIHESIAELLASDMSSCDQKYLQHEPGTIFCQQHYRKGRIF